MEKIDFDQEIASFKKKAISKDDPVLVDLYRPINEMAASIKSMDRVGKKSVLQMESSMQELIGQLNHKHDDILRLRLEKNQAMQMNERIINKLIQIMDEIDAMVRLLRRSGDCDDIVDNYLAPCLKSIAKNTGEIGLVEVRAFGEIFDEEVHECVKRINDISKRQFEIVDVISRGYVFNGKLIRPALVVAVNNSDQG